MEHINEMKQYVSDWESTVTAILLDFNKNSNSGIRNKKISKINQKKPE